MVVVVVRLSQMKVYINDYIIFIDNELANEVPVVGKPVVRGRGSRKTKSNEGIFNDI